MRLGSLRRGFQWSADRLRRHTPIAATPHKSVARPAGSGTGLGMIAATRNLMFQLSGEVDLDVPAVQTLSRLNGPDQVGRWR